MNFKNIGNEPPREGGNFGLAQQSSIYSLTFGELQNTVVGVGKDFGSMNMDELLKNIWSAEGTQTMGSTCGGGQQNLQRQGSLTLPRTLSQKTVDEIWKNVSKDYDVGGSNLPQRQPTLGEVTLEEFLVKAGVVREDPQVTAKPNTTGYFGDFQSTNHNTNNTVLGIGFQQTGIQNSELLGIRIPNSNNHVGVQSASSMMPQLFPKQPTMAYPNPLGISNSAQLGGSGLRGGIAGIGDPPGNGNLVQSMALQGGGLGMVNLGGGAVNVGKGSPGASSDGIGKSNGDTSSVSPVTHVFNGGFRGRKPNGAVEKVVERRQRRMIKNRESAARSRARKQAYTMELEAEVAKLKEENQELQKKQEEIAKMQKVQVLEMMNSVQQGAKRRCLRRTQTGPW